MPHKGHDPPGSRQLRFGGGLDIGSQRQPCRAVPRTPLTATRASGYARILNLSISQIRWRRFWPTGAGEPRPTNSEVSAGTKGTGNSEALAHCPLTPWCASNESGRGFAFLSETEVGLARRRVP